MVASYSVDVERFCLTEPVSSQKGIKTAQLTIDNQAVHWLPEPLEVAFEPKSYDGSEQTRVNLCLLASDTVAEQLANIDDALVKLAALHSVTLFGKTLSPEMVKVIYTPLLYRKDQYSAMLRTKLITAGRNQTKCWDADTKLPIEFPHDWKGRKVSTKVLLKGLWFQGNSFGAMAELTDVLVGERQAFKAICPWGV